MNGRPKLGSGKRGVNVRLWVITACASLCEALIVDRSAVNVERDQSHGLGIIGHSRQRPVHDARYNIVDDGQRHQKPFGGTDWLAEAIGQLDVEADGVKDTVDQRLQPWVASNGCWTRLDTASSISTAFMRFDRSNVLARIGGTESSGGR
jgi:hypothetical protein